MLNKHNNNNNSAGVGLLISDRWIDRIIDVKRVNERIMCLKVLIGDKLVTCICAHVPQTGRSAEEKDPFWDQMISVTESIPASELIVVGGDLNGHVGTNVDGMEFMADMALEREMLMVSGY